MFLMDTNIFLEILLGQEKEKACRNFLMENKGRLYVSDFSLYSIGVILFRLKRFDVFEECIKDILPLIPVIVLKRVEFREVIKIGKEVNTDFDDSYQIAVAKSHHLGIVTMDRDFKKVIDKVAVKFI